MKRIFYLLLISITFTSGCNNWLDILPKDEQVTADFWRSKEDVEAMLASGYYYMRNSTKSLINWGELRGSSIYAFSSLEEGKLQDFQLTPSSPLCRWDVFYQVVNISNSILKYAPGVEKIDSTYQFEAMQSHLTEAYFMRALMYFYLVRNFKEVPLVLEPYIDDSAPFNIAKSTEDEILNQIIDDIETALKTNAAKEFFDEDLYWSGVSKARATKWALYALMTDVSLWAEDYEKSIEYADRLIHASATRRPAFLTISEDWFQIFNPGNSNESIFELNWDYSTYDQTDNSPSNYFTISETSSYQYSPAMIERLDRESEFIEEQNREPVRSYWGAYVTLGDGGESDVYCIWKYRGTEINDINAQRTNSDANWIIYRMADVMLLKAEALIRRGENSWGEALDILNQIRERANLNELDINLEDVDEVTMLEHVLAERDIELAAEGKRWYDLLRFGKSENYKYKDQFINLIVENNSSANDSWIRSVLRNQNAWYLPISDSEIEVNSLLEQNPYYSVTN